MAFFEIGIYHPRREQNVGTLWRSAFQLDAAGIFTIGRRYKPQPSDVFKTIHHIPLRHYATFDEFLQHRPIGAELVGIELGGTPLSQFQHPLKASYLLGSEDNGLPSFILKQCNAIVSLEAATKPSYNLAVAGSIVMYHRCFLNENRI